MRFNQTVWDVDDPGLAAIYKTIVSPTVSGDLLASSNTANANFVRLWLAGSGSLAINWGDGNVDNITLQAELTEYTHQYDGGSYQIRVDTPANITEIKSGLSADFTIDYANINNTTTFTSLEYFENTEYGATLTGNPFTELTNVTLIVSDPVDPNVGDFNNDFNNDFY